MTTEKPEEQRTAIQTVAKVRQGSLSHLSKDPTGCWAYEIHGVEYSIRIPWCNVYVLLSDHSSADDNSIHNHPHSTPSLALHRSFLSSEADE
jgi:hypothetical protein